MKKPRKKAAPAGAEPRRWAVYILKSKATWIGFVVDAGDEGGARAKAIKELEIGPADQWRISVRRE